MATIVIIDATTNTVIEREETTAETAARAELHSERDANIAAAQAAAAAKVSALIKLKDLGLTDAEVAALTTG